MRCNWMAGVLVAVMLGVGCEHAEDGVEGNRLATAGVNGFVKIGPEDMWQLASRAPMPAFPRESVEAGRSGVAVASVRVDADGSVIDVDVLEAPDRAIALEVAQAVRRWSFGKVTVSDRTESAAYSGRLIMYFSIVKGEGVVTGGAQREAGDSPQR